MPPRGHARSRGLTKTPSQVSPFEFVTSSGPPNDVRNASDRSRTIRVHAMRHFLQHRGAILDDTAQKEVLSAMPQETATQATTGKFKLATWSRKGRGSKPSIALQKKRTGRMERERISLTIGKRLGPLMSLIIPSTPLTARLLDHCQYVSLSTQLARLTFLE